MFILSTLIYLLEYFVMLIDQSLVHLYCFLFLLFYLEYINTDVLYDQFIDYIIVWFYNIYNISQFKYMSNIYIRKVDNKQSIIYFYFKLFITIFLLACYIIIKNLFFFFKSIILTCFGSNSKYIYKLVYIFAEFLEIMENKVYNAYE